MPSTTELPIALNGVVYSIPPLPFKICEKIYALLPQVIGSIAESSGIIGLPRQQTLQNLVTIIHTAIAYKHPELTFDQFTDDVLPLSDLYPALTVVMNQVGLEVKEAAPGEAAGQ